MSENHYATDVNGAAEYFADVYIRESARLRDAASIGDFMESEGLVWSDSKEEDWDELRDAIYDKIGTAELDISW